MEIKSSTQRVSFFLHVLANENVRIRMSGRVRHDKMTILNLKKFHHQIIANLQ